MTPLKFAAAVTLAISTVLSPATHAQNFDAQNSSIELLTLSTRNLAMSLTDQQKEKALFPMGDKEWLNIRLAPFGTKGLKFKEMKPGQIAIIHTVMNAGFSASGYHKAASIMALEEYMEELKLRGDSAAKDDNAHGIGNYSIALFGTPESDSSWSIRLHGHHLYLSFGVADGKLVSTGPSFFGAQPHEVTEGPRKGWHVLRDEENQGRDLLLSMNKNQKSSAIISETMPRDVFSGNNADISNLKSDDGIAYTDLNDKQKEMLKALVMEHVYDIPRDLAYTRLDKIEKGGWENTRFAWIGSTKKKERMYYRVQGPEFMIEYCVTTLGENHIHTVWREFNGDFGRDILADHLKAVAH